MEEKVAHKFIYLNLFSVWKSGSDRFMCVFAKLWRTRVAKKKNIRCEKKVTQKKHFKSSSLDWQLKYVFPCLATIAHTKRIHLNQIVNIFLRQKKWSTGKEGTLILTVLFFSSYSHITAFEHQVKHLIYLFRLKSAPTLIKWNECLYIRWKINKSKKKKNREIKLWWSQNKTQNIVDHKNESVWEYMYAYVYTLYFWTNSLTLYSLFWWCVSC